jgi:hypothetical protein
MPLDPRRVKALFNSSLDAADRAAFLEQECGDEQELRERLNDLLAPATSPPVPSSNPW